MPTNDELSTRIDKMGAWAKQTEASIVKLQERISASAQVGYGEGDQLAMELGELFLRYDGMDAKILELEKEIFQIDKEITENQRLLDDIKAKEWLAIFSAINTETGKAQYGNDAARDAALRLALRDIKTYKDLTSAQDDLGVTKSTKKAEIKQLERQLGQYGKRNYAMSARLTYITGKIQVARTGLDGQKE